jgi:hypothetical protein
MKRITFAAITAAAVLLSGCVTPSPRGRRATNRGKIGGKVSDLIDSISSRAGRKKTTVPVRIRVRPVAPGFMQLVCTEDPGTRILLYAYYDASGTLLEGTYYCYSSGGPEPAGRSIVWTKQPPEGDGSPEEYERYSFVGGVLVRAEWYRRGARTPFRIDERDSRGIERRIVSYQDGGIHHEERIGQHGFPVTKKTFKDGNYIRSKTFTGPFETLAAERVGGGRNISGTLLPNYRYFRAAKFQFVLVVDPSWNVDTLSAREEAVRFDYVRDHNNSAGAADAIEKCFGWTLKEFITQVRSRLKK